MSGKNANIQLTALDFDLIKKNLKTYLSSQAVLKDANYEGSVLSILLDILSYNTYYNGYYLNMIANELFLDTASKRQSVVSIAKLLGYTPDSIHSCIGIINFTIHGLNVPDFTLPKNTKFLSEQINNKYYTFVTKDDYYGSVENSSITFENVELIEGEPSSIRTIYRKIQNPKCSFLIPDTNVDLNTLAVYVQNSTIDPTITIYNKKEYFNSLDSESLVYFIEENSDGYYEVIFGDGILGKELHDGNVVVLNYIVSSGTSSVGARKFKLIDSLDATYTTTSITLINSAFGGKEKQSIDSIKYSAPKYFSAQNRAVTYQDYITALINNKENFSFDSVNVWGGQDNDPPVYGKAFLSMKPTGGYTLTQAQKELIVQKIIKPINILTVEPTIVDPDYVFLKVVTDVVYDPTKTLLTPNVLARKIKTAIFTFANESLNSFNSVFSYPDLMYAIQNADPSILTNETKITLQKQFLPNFEVPMNFSINFGCPLEKGILSAGISSSPGMSFYDKTNSVTLIEGVYLEEIPSSSGGIDSITITNKGYGYTSIPTITITGDGEGGNAHAVVVNGSIRNIVIDDPGRYYTTAKISISGGGGKLGSAIASAVGKYGTLQLIYYNKKHEKVVLNSSVGKIDYTTGIVTLDSFNPVDVNNPLGQLTISAKPKTNIIYSKLNTLLTIDPFNTTSVVVKVKSKT